MTFGIMTLRVKTVTKMTLVIKTLSKMSVSSRTFNVMAFCIMTFRFTTLVTMPASLLMIHVMAFIIMTPWITTSNMATFSNNNIQHFIFSTQFCDIKGLKRLGIMTLRVTTFSLNKTQHNGI